MTFATFRGNAIQYAALWRAFAQSHLPRFALLVLVGPLGTGKTHLAAAACHRWRDEQHGEALFLRAGDLAMAARQDAALERSGQASPRVLSDARRIGMLAIDDVGAEHRSAFSDGALYRLIVERYEEDRPTIITTNATLEALGDRLADRLADRRHSCLVAIPAAQSFRSQPEALDALGLIPDFSGESAIETPYHHHGGLSDRPIICTTCHSRPCLAECQVRTFPPYRPWMEEEVKR